MRKSTVKFTLVICIAFFVMPLLVACMGKKQYTVNFDFRAGGEVYVATGEITVEHATSHTEGSVLTITVTPDPMFLIVSVKAGTTDLIGVNGVYMHTLTGDVTLRVRFMEIID